MKNNKGQALIEFVILLPVFLMLILGVFDVGNILYNKYELSNHLDYITDLCLDNKKDKIFEYANENNIKYELNNKDNKTKIVVKRNISIITPGLNTVLGKSYLIRVERMVYHE